MSDYKEINVGSYGNLEEGSSIIRKASSNLRSGLENTDGFVRNIQKPRVFEGPVADHVSGVWDIINKTTNDNISNFEKSANTLDRVNANYHNIDKKSSNDIGGVI